MLAAVELCKYLIAKYQIEPRNGVGHSDIAYSRENNFLNRKQDPSHLFDWKFLSENGVGIFPQNLTSSEETLFRLGDKNPQIAEIKKDLKNFGYRVINLNDEFDQEMEALALVFNRRFSKKDLNFWCLNSQQVLLELKEYVLP